MKNVTKLLGKIFNRFTIMVVLICIQFVWLGLMLIKLGDYAEWINMAFTALAVLMTLFVIYRDDNPAYKMGWILLICILPILGASMYALFGNKRPSKRIKAKLDPIAQDHLEDLKQVHDVDEMLDDRLMTTIDYIKDYGPFPAWTDSKTNYFETGDVAFESLLEDLKGAEHYIFMEYFIIGTGYMWDTIFNVLVEKVKEGVDVRVIYDDVGSISKIPISFNRTLEENGIKVMNFNPLRPIASLVYNNRDHRKLTVIDGYIAHTGGYNIADEYINKEERFGHWKDSGLRVEGEAAWNFTVMFLNMWNAFEFTEEDYSKYKPKVHHKEPFDSDGIVQPYSDSPLDDENIGENVYLEIINQAKDYVYIFTPYLILDNEMITCIQLAAKRGVDVRIVTPGIPDKKLVFRLTRSYYLPLIKAGARIYEYSPGFIHAKSILSDDTVGVVGTINFDYRSLFLHFECGTLMIGCSALSSLKQDCKDTFATSLEIERKDCRNGFIGSLIDGILRALSPLM